MSSSRPSYSKENNLPLKYTPPPPSPTYALFEWPLSSDLKKGHLGYSVPHWDNLLLRKKAPFEEEREEVHRASYGRSTSIFPTRQHLYAHLAVGVWQFSSEWMDASCFLYALTKFPGQLLSLILHPSCHIHTLPEHFLSINKAFAHNIFLTTCWRFNLWRQNYALRPSLSASNLFHTDSLREFHKPTHKPLAYRIMSLSKPIKN